MKFPSIDCYQSWIAFRSAAGDLAASMIWLSMCSYGRPDDELLALGLFAEFRK